MENKLLRFVLQPFTSAPTLAQELLESSHGRLILMESSKNDDLHSK